MLYDLTSPIFDNAKTLMKYGPMMFPFVYEESEIGLTACRKTAWMSCGLTMTSPIYDITGKDAVKFMNRTCVNRDYALLKTGGSRHCIICNEEGFMQADGVCLKLGEDHFRTYWLAPVIKFYLEKAKESGLAVEGITLDSTEYFFQVDGPKSLEILEDACQTNLHDLKFAQNKMVKIDGKDMRVHRLGMSGALAYEVHGPMAEAEEIYRIIRDTGKKYGLVEISDDYCTNHTQGGYPNQGVHYMYPYIFNDGSELFKYCEQIRPWHVQLKGSAANDKNAFLVSPYDVGWGGRVNFDHEFIGKKALQKIAAAKATVPVTLEWNAEDAAAVFATQFMGPEVTPCETISDVRSPMKNFSMEYFMDRIYDGDAIVGRSAGRIQDFYHHRMLSLGFISTECAQLGRELRVLWGTPGTPQKYIRVKVAPFPYYNGEFRNETCDVEKLIPRKY